MKPINLSLSAATKRSSPAVSSRNSRRPTFRGLLFRLEAHALEKTSAQISQSEGLAARIAMLLNICHT
jgi:hypothetical protein